MTDFLSPEQRSLRMALIHSKNTKSEIIVYRYLRRNNVYFQKHYSKVPGKPDIALPRKKKAVFIDGDFWHGRNISHLEKSREHNDYWIVKIKNNVMRDNRQRLALEDAGWKLLCIWESDIKRIRTRQETLDLISDFLLTS